MGSGFCRLPAISIVNGAFYLNSIFSCYSCRQSKLILSGQMPIHENVEKPPRFPCHGHVLLNFVGGHVIGTHSEKSAFRITHEQSNI